MPLLELHILDYVIVGVLAVCTIGIAICFTCVRTSVTDCLHGNHKMASFPLTLSLAACYVSFATVQVCRRLLVRDCLCKFRLTTVWLSQVMNSCTR